MTMWEKRTLENEFTLGNDAGTYQLKLPKSGALSHLQLMLQWTGGGTESHTQSIFEAFDLIEIVANGSYTLWSLTPHELYMWLHYFGKRNPVFLRDEGASGVHQIILNIPFSLKPKDRSYYLPLAAWKDVELRVSFSPTIAATAGFATGTGVVDVKAIITNDLPDNASAGYLRLRTVYTFTSTTSGDTRQEIVGNFPLIALGVYAYEAQIAAHANITDVEVQIRDGQRSIFKDDFARLRRSQLLEMGIEAEEQGSLFIQNADDLYYFGDDIQALLTQVDIGAITIGTTAIPHLIPVEQLAHQSEVRMYNDTANGAATAQVAYATDVDVFTHIKYNSVPRGGIIPFAFDGQFENAPVPSGVSKMELILTNGNAGADVRVTQLELANVVNV